MKSLRLLLCMICASFALVGCSYFDTGETIEVEKPAQPSKIDLTTGEEYTEPSAETVMDIDGPYSQGNVEIYGLDSAPGRTRYFDPGTILGNNGPTSAVDPSVQVFPLDDDMRSVTPPRNLPWEDSAVHSPISPPDSFNPASAPSPLVPMASASSLSPPPVPVSGRSTVYFEHGESSLDGGDEATIEQIAQDFDHAPSLLLSVEGHASQNADIADPVSRKIMNLKISMNRALSVARSLMRRGVPAESIRTVAWGETQPPVNLAGMDAESAARRVEIITQ